MKEVFADLYEKYHHELFQFLFYMVKNREQAEDLVQDVYIKVLKSYQNFKGNSSEKTWIFSIAKHSAIDWFRKQSRWNKRLGQSVDDEESNVQLQDEAPLPEEMVIQNEEIQRLYKCLEYCTVDQKMVIILRYIQSFSITETADILNWTESKVKTTQHRGIKALKAFLEKSNEKEANQDEKIKL